MKYLLYVLILLFTAPAFAGNHPRAFTGANEISDEPVIIEDDSIIIKDHPVVAEEPDFKIDERLYAESIGSNGYYGGGFYGEERYAAQIDYFTITSRSRDFGLGTGFIVVDDQIVSVNLGSPFLAFPFFNSGIVPGGIGINIGNFTFFRGGLGRGGFGFGHRHR